MSVITKLNLNPVLKNLILQNLKRIFLQISKIFGLVPLNRICFLLFEKMLLWPFFLRGRKNENDERIRMAGEGTCQCPKRKRQVFVLMAILCSLFVGFLYFFKGNVKNLSLY